MSMEDFMVAKIKKVFAFVLIASALVLTVSSCKDKVPDTEQYQIYLLAQDSGYSGTYEEWLESIKGAAGANGAPGLTTEIRVNDGVIQWKYTTEGASSWRNLINISQLEGEAGKTPEIRVNEGMIQWKYTIETSWKNLISIEDLAGSDGIDGTDGKDGSEIELRVANNYIQWRYKDSTTWTNLVAYEDLVSDAGEKYTVTFDANGGILPTGVANQITNISEGKAITLPIPTKEGYIFKGWYTGNTANDGQFYNYSPVLANLNLKAKWEEDTFKVTIIMENYIPEEVDYEVPFGTVLNDYQFDSTELYILKDGNNQEIGDDYIVTNDVVLYCDEVHVSYENIMYNMNNEYGDLLEYSEFMNLITSFNCPPMDGEKNSLIEAKKFAKQVLSQILEDYGIENLRNKAVQKIDNLLYNADECIVNYETEIAPFIQESITYINAANIKELVNFITTNFDTLSSSEMKNNFYYQLIEHNYQYADGFFDTIKIEIKREIIEQLFGGNDEIFGNLALGEEDLSFLINLLSSEFDDNGTCQTALNDATTMREVMAVLDKIRGIISEHTFVSTNFAEIKAACCSLAEGIHYSVFPTTIGEEIKTKINALEAAETINEAILAFISLGEIAYELDNQIYFNLSYSFEKYIATSTDDSLALIYSTIQSHEELIDKVSKLMTIGISSVDGVVERIIEFEIKKVYVVDEEKLTAYILNNYLMSIKYYENELNEWIQNNNPTEDYSDLISGYVSRLNSATTEREMQKIINDCQQEVYSIIHWEQEARDNIINALVQYRDACELNNYYYIGDNLLSNIRSELENGTFANVSEMEAVADIFYEFINLVEEKAQDMQTAYTQAGRDDLKTEYNEAIRNMCNATTLEDVNDYATGFMDLVNRG